MTKMCVKLIMSSTYVVYIHIYIYLSSSAIHVYDIIITIIQKADATLLLKPYQKEKTALSTYA